MQVRQRRRARTFAPEMLEAVREALATGASSTEVVQAIARRQADGELHHGDQPLAAPSESTVKSIAREMTRDDSAAWTLEDASPEEARLVLRVLSAVANKSRGRVKHLTKREAHLAAVYLAVRPGVDGFPPHGRAWAAYVSARVYLARLNRGEDLADEHLHLQGIAEIEDGLEYRPGMVDPMLKTDPPLKEEPDARTQ
jgi:hypothetical protein